MTRLPIGLVGGGRLAELGYLPAAALGERTRITAVADPDPQRRALFSGEGIRAFPSIEELLDTGGVQALVVASPPGAHEHAAGVAAEAGLPTLVEKPPAPDAAGAARIAALAAAPWIGFNRRYSLGRGLADVVPKGGAITLELRYRRFSWAPYEVRDPALIDLAPHLVDLALRAGMGAPRAVVARSGSPQRIEIEIEGARGHAALACACDRPHRERAAVRDADGGIVARRRVGGLARGAALRVLRRPHPLVASLAAQLDEFALAARGEPAPTLATAVDGAAAMAVIAAAADSLAHGGEPAPAGAGISTA